MSESAPESRADDWIADTHHEVVPSGDPDVDAMEVVADFEAADRAAEGENVSTTVSRGMLWNMVSAGTVEVATLVQFLILPVFITPEERGNYAIAAAVAFLALQLRDFSTGLKYIQDRKRPREEAFNIAFSLELMLALGGTIVIAACAPILGAAYGDSELTWLVLAMAPLGLGALVGLPEYHMVRNMDFRSRFWRLGVAQLSGVVATIWAAVAGWGVWALVIGFPVQMVVGLVTLWPGQKLRPRFVWDKPAYREYFAYGWPVWLASIFIFVFLFLTTNVITILFGVAIVGFFSVAWRIVELQYRLNLKSTLALYPAVVNRRGDIESQKRLFVVSNKIMMAISAPVGVVLVYFSRDLVTFWKPDWAPVVPFMQSVGAFFVFGTLAFDWDVFYRARGETRPMSKLTGALDLTLPAFLAIVWVMGVPGIYVSIVLIGVWLYVVRSYYIRKLLGKVSAVRCTWPIVVAAFGTGAIGWLVTQALGGGLWPAAVAGLAVAMVLYLGVFALIERKLVTFTVGSLLGRSTGGLQALVGDDPTTPSAP